MKQIWIIGTGAIGIEYAKILTALNTSYIAIGRSEKASRNFEEATGQTAIAGGLENFLKTSPELPEAAIIAVGVTELAETTKQLIAYGVNNVLLEKPGGVDFAEIRKLSDTAATALANVLLAYNRRFYSSVLKAEEIIKEDGGVTSFNFEFTEWSHTLENLDRPAALMQNWLLANSTHVIDTAFFLGGSPVQLCSFHKGGTKWHPSGAIYAGAGESNSGALFSYQANWEAPGRWSVEILTKKNRLYLKPMESLQIQVIGSVAVNPVEVDNHLDKKFKPGFYLQTKAFLEKDYTRFCTIHQQKDKIDSLYLKMSGY